MRRATIEFLDAGTGGHVHRAYKARMIDWTEGGSALLSQMTRYKERYREKICPSCSKDEQRRRGCHRDVVDGRVVTSCGHMDAACGKKFKKSIEAHWSFHPALFGSGQAGEQGGMVTP